jgi:hypothetical protein
MEQELRTLQAYLRASQADQNRGELFVSSGRAGGDLEGGRDPTKAGNRMLKEASALLDKTRDSLSNTKNMTAASKEVGVATLEELQRQLEVIHNIEKETDRVDENLARAEALMKRFGKNGVRRHPRLELARQEHALERSHLLCHLPSLPFQRIC